MAPARILAHIRPVASVILASLPFRRSCGVRLFSLSGNSLMAVQSATHQRRALELLAASAKQGCTEAFLLAHGFTLDLLTDMVRAGLATAQIERARAGGQTRLHITDAGRRALRGKRDAE
jgi:hypothetical protein